MDAFRQRMELWGSSDGAATAGSYNEQVGKVTEIKSNESRSAYTYMYTHTGTHTHCVVGMLFAMAACRSLIRVLFAEVHPIRKDKAVGYTLCVCVSVCLHNVQVWRWTELDWGNPLRDLSFMVWLQEKQEVLRMRALCVQLRAATYCCTCGTRLRLKVPY